MTNIIFKKPLVLVGMMGSGKSTVGRKLAKKLNLKFYDSDKTFEEREGLSLIDIHDFMGEKYFKEKEEEIIKEILNYGVVVLSIGGSSFINKNIREYIKENTISIWLDSSLETIYERVSRRNTRPELVNSNDKKELIKKLLDERNPIFSEADIKVKSDIEAYLLVNNIVEELENFLSNKI